MTEMQLIERACGGDEEAIRTLYERYAPRVYAIVRRIAGDDEVASDYAQEAWIRAIRALPTFRGEARFSTWLHRIAVNAALQAERTVRRTRDREAEVPASLAASEPEPDVLLVRRLERALARLPDGMRRVLVLHDVEGYTHEEIGELLGIATGTSKSQLFKARARMRAVLEEENLPRGEEGLATWNT